MNITKLRISSIDRIIAHEIHPKTEKKDAFAKTKAALLEFSKSEKDILTQRMIESLGNTSKTFQLDYEDKSEGSVYQMMEKIKSIKDEEFINKSKSLANDLAAAHFRTKIPGGYCLIGNGKTADDKYFFFVIKAELQEVFNIQGNKLKLIKDVFLSPAKDFYKIGFFIESGKHFIPFMYDDQFSMQKKDLTEYFYGNFLGLTTDKVDELRTKNFYEDTKLFIESNVDNMHDRTGLLKALTVLYREEASGIISAKEFSKQYFEGDLKDRYDKKIVDAKYPTSFTKDISLMENKLEHQRMSIPLMYSLSLVGSAEELHAVDIIDNPTTGAMKKLEPQINNGKIKQLVVLKQA